MEKCYIGKENGTYIISRNKNNPFDTSEFGCTKEELSSFSKIPAGDMITIKKKIEAILYRSQLELKL